MDFLHLYYTTVGDRFLYFCSDNSFFLEPFCLYTTSFFVFCSRHLVYNIFCLHYEHILFYSERSAYMKSIQAFGTPDTKLSRGSYIMECTFEYFVALLVCDSFLSLLLTSMGLSEALIGVISSIISLAFLFEFAAVFVIQRVVNTKRFAIFFHTASELFFLSLYLIPLIPALKPYRALVVILCTLAAYFGNYLLHVQSVYSVCVI